MHVGKIVHVVVPSLALLAACAAQQKMPVADPPVTQDDIQDARERKEIGSAVGEYAFAAEPPRSAMVAQNVKEQRTALDLPQAAPVAVTPAVSPPPAAPCEGDLATVVRQTTLHFDFDKDELTPLSQQYLRTLSDVLRKYPTAKILVSGYCDDIGTEEYNLRLGERRATAAANYLVGLGIDATRIDTTSYSFQRPADNRHNAEARALNRRVEFSLRTQAAPAISSRDESE